MDTKDVGKLIEDLKHENESVRWSAVSALAESADEGIDLASAVPSLANVLLDPKVTIRMRAAYTLVSIAEHQGDISAALPALSKTLSDESEDIRKEVVWALYCLAYEGRDIEAAVPALVNCLNDKSRSVRGNGAIGLTLHYLNVGKANKAKELLKRKDEAIQFGAAWGHTDFYLKTKKKAKLRELIKSIRLGLLDASIRDGLVGALSWARERGVDISFALSVIHGLLSKTDDPVEQAPLYGILMKLNKQD